MTLGELFLKSLSSGVITQGEVDWLASHQHAFSRHEEAAAIRLGRLMDEGVVNLGCRVSPQWLHHRDVLEHWIEPLGRRRHAAWPLIQCLILAVARVPEICERVVGASGLELPAPAQELPPSAA